MYKSKVERYIQYRSLWSISVSSNVLMKVECVTSMYLGRKSVHKKKKEKTPFTEFLVVCSVQIRRVELIKYRFKI